MSPAVTRQACVIQYSRDSQCAANEEQPEGPMPPVIVAYGYRWVPIVVETHGRITCTAENDVVSAAAREVWGTASLEDHVVYFTLKEDLKG